MTYAIAVALGLIVSVSVWKIAGPRLKVPKEDIWGLSVVAGIVVPSLYIEYSFNLLSDPFMYFSTAVLSVLLYCSNRTFYKQYNSDKQSKKK